MMGVDTKDMVLSEDLKQYITEPDNIYDLAGNCYGLLCEKISNPSAFINDYLSKGEGCGFNPNFEHLKQFSEEVMRNTQCFKASHYNEFIMDIVIDINKLMSEMKSYLDENMNELAVIFSLLAGIDAGARTWEVHKLSSGTGPLDRIHKTGYRVYFSSHNTFLSEYEERVGRDRMHGSDFSAEFETFRFINTKDWRMGENVPRIIYIPYDYRLTQKCEKKLKAAVIPGLNEKNFEFVKTKGGGVRVEYSGIDQGKAVKKVTASLKRVLETDCDIIVLSEYLTSPEVYQAIRRDLKVVYRKRGPGAVPLLTFAGTMWTDDDNNVLRILDACGDEIGCYYKYSPYTEKRKHQYGYELYEDLSDPGKYCDLVSVEKWGLLLPAVCRDVIDGKYTEEIARLLLPVLVIISAWSPSVSTFVERQRELANRYFISSILANACSAVRKETKRIGNAGIVHKKNTIPDISVENMCRSNCVDTCSDHACAYIIEFDFTYNKSSNTGININKL